MQVSEVKVEIAKIIGIKAPNRQVLVDAVRQVIRGSSEPLAPALFDEPTIFLSVRLDICGSLVDFPTEADVPETSVPCPCGNPKHWIIKYEE